MNASLAAILVKRAVVLFLAVCAVSNAYAGVVFTETFSGSTGPSGGGSGCYDNANWHEVDAAVDSCFSGQLRMTADGGGTYHDFTGENEAWIQFKLTAHTAASERNVFFIGDGTDLLGFISVNLANDAVKLYDKNGTHSISLPSTTGGIAADTQYNFILHYLKGSGANGVIDVGYSTGTPPQSGTEQWAQLTASPATTQASRVEPYLNAGTGDIRITDIVVNDTDPGGGGGGGAVSTTNFTVSFPSIRGGNEIFADVCVPTTNGVMMTNLILDIYQHGYTSDAAQRMVRLLPIDFMDAIATNFGYRAVMCVRGPTNETGLYNSQDDSGMNDMMADLSGKFYAMTNATFGSCLNGHVVADGGSMGGCESLGFMMHFPGHADRCAALFPVADLSDTNTTYTNALIALNSGEAIPLLYTNAFNGWYWQGTGANSLMNTHIGGNPVDAAKPWLLDSYRARNASVGCPKNMPNGLTFGWLFGDYNDTTVYLSSSMWWTNRMGANGNTNWSFEISSSLWPHQTTHTFPARHELVLTNTAFATQGWFPSNGVCICPGFLFPKPEVFTMTITATNEIRLTYGVAAVAYTNGVFTVTPQLSGRTNALFISYNGATTNVVLVAATTIDMNVSTGGSGGVRLPIRRRP